jgi:hypothetical protein
MFDTDLSTIDSEIREEMSDLSITMEKYRIRVPDLKLQPKELKALEVKLPSILEEYKAVKGIVNPPPK